jgi:ATP-dependent DNA helicase RecQ
VIRQLQSRDVLVSPAEARGGLSFGADALVRPLLRGEEPVELALPDPTPSGRRSRRPTSGTTAAGTGAAIDPGDPLLAALKAWRLAQAREQGVPPYVVFHDRTLLELTGQRPLTLEQLSAVGGIGRAKLERYGEALLQVLTDRDL